MSEFNVLPIFGTANIGSTITNTQQINTIYEILLANGCHTIDTARLYGESEAVLGKTGAADKFTIDSKTTGGFTKGEDTGENILKHARESVQRLKVKQLDVFYFHSPDTSLDMEDQLSGLDKAYKEGLFKRFGLSNFSAEQVERVHSLAKEKGWVLPTVSRRRGGTK
jgi:aflatoxin B1 aldehyde reductase